MLSLLPRNIFLDVEYWLLGLSSPLCRLRLAPKKFHLNLINTGVANRVVISKGLHIWRVKNNNDASRGNTKESELLSTSGPGYLGLFSKSDGEGFCYVNLPLLWKQHNVPVLWSILTKFPLVSKNNAILTGNLCNFSMTSHYLTKYYKFIYLFGELALFLPYHASNRRHFRFFPLYFNFLSKHATHFVFLLQLMCVSLHLCPTSSCTRMLTR